MKDVANAFPDTFYSSITYSVPIQVGDTLQIDLYPSCGYGVSVGNLYGSTSFKVVITEEHLAYSKDSITITKDKYYTCAGASSVFMVSLNGYSLEEITTQEITSLSVISDYEQVKLYWSGVNDSFFEYYTVYLDDDPIAITKTNSFTVSDFPTLDADISNIVNALPLSVPIDLFYSDVSDSSVFLFWDAPYSEYDLYLNNSFFTSLSGNDFTLSNLEPNALYSVYLVAIDSYGREVVSNEINFLTDKEDLVENKLELLDVDHESITVGWNSSGEDAVYSLYLNGEFVSLTSYLSYKFTSLDHSTVYSIQLKSVDKYGRSFTSDTLEVMTRDPPDPVEPILRYYSLTDSSVTLSWSDSGEFYKIYQDGVLLSETESLYLGVSGLESNSTYTFYVVSVDMYDRETSSNILTITTKDSDYSVSLPPEVSVSNNDDLNLGNDFLIEGAKEQKQSFLSLIVVIIMLIILIFGIFWLIKLWKRNMTRANN